MTRSSISSVNICSELQALPLSHARPLALSVRLNQTPSYGRGRESARYHVAFAASISSSRRDGIVRDHAEPDLGHLLLGLPAPADAQRRIGRVVEVAGLSHTNQASIRKPAGTRSGVRSASGSE